MEQITVKSTHRSRSRKRQNRRPRKPAVAFTETITTRARSKSRSASTPVATTVSVSQPSASNLYVAPNRRVRPLPSSRVITRASRRPRDRLTAQGRGWLKLYLNPMGKDAPDITGYPDGSSTRSVIANYAQEFEVTYPANTSVWATLGNVQILDAANYNKFFTENCSLMVLALPTLEYAYCLRIYANTPTVTPHTRSVVNDPSKLIYPNWGAFGPDGVLVNHDQDALFYQSFVKLDNVRNHADNASALRLIARATTLDYTVDQLHEQGHVTSCQFATEPTLDTEDVDVIDTVNINFDAKTSNSTSTKVVGRLLRAYRLMNLAPAAIAECFPGHYTSKALDGCYQPLYNSSRDNPFVGTLPLPISLATTNTTIDDGAVLNDVCIPGWNFGVTWFNGVSTNFSILMKHRSVIQFVAVPGGILSNFTMAPAVDDEIALQASWRLRNKLAHAYPSIYNDWGWLGDLVDAGISMIPGIGEVYKNVKPYIKPSWDWLGGKVKDYFGNWVNGQTF